MADDLVIGLSMETQDFLREMQKSNNALRDLGEQGKRTNSLLGSLKWSFAANSLGVMIQDMTTVASMGANFNQILNAGANNAIQLATQLHPVAGAVTAAGIAGYQLYSILSGSAAEAKKLKEETEAISKGLSNFGGDDIQGGMAKQAQKLVQEWGSLHREIEMSDKAFARVMDKRNKLVDSNTNIFGYQMDNPQITAEIAKMDALLANITEARNKAASRLSANEALQEIIAPEARIAIGEEANRKLREKSKAERKKALDDEMETRKLIGERVKKQLDDEKKAIEINKEANREREKWLADMDTKRREDAKAVRDSLLNPREQLAKEAQRLSFLPLTDEERTKSLMKQAAMAFNGGPQLSAGLVKGTIEEESSKNRREAEQRNKEFIKQMVKDIIRELKPKEPPPEVVVGGGH